MIELRKVSKRFVDNVVLDQIDFTVKRGETVALLGPSGTGKSVLLKHIIGLIKPDSGDVVVDGLSVPTLGRKELSELRSHIGYVFPRQHVLRPARARLPAPRQSPARGGAEVSVGAVGRDEEARRHRAGDRRQAHVSAI